MNRNQAQERNKELEQVTVMCCRMNSAARASVIVDWSWRHRPSADRFGPCVIHQYSSICTELCVIIDRESATGSHLQRTSLVGCVSPLCSSDLT